MSASSYARYEAAINAGRKPSPADEPEDGMDATQSLKVYNLASRINAIHACSSEDELRAAYAEHIHEVSGDDAAEWAIREATYAMKLRLGLVECDDDGPEYMPDDERDHERCGHFGAAA